MNLTITPRQAAAVLGVLAMLAGLIALSIPVTAISDSGLFGASETRCGNGLLDRTGDLGGDPLIQCQDALGSRRAWAWPLGIVGLLLVAGAAVVKPAPKSSDQETADTD